jgi:hypothetical protein
MTNVIWVFCLFVSMKILITFLLGIFYTLTLSAQSLIALIDRDNSSAVTNAEGQGVNVTGLSRGPGISKTTGNATD